MSLKNSLLFPIIQSVHLTGIALLVGTIVLIDLRIMGWVLPKHTISEIRLRLTSWNRAGLAIMLTTGPVLFAADVPRYISNPAFIVKMAVLLAALVFHFAWHTRPETPGKLNAVVSMVLWTCVVLGGRAIADFDI